MLDEKLGRYGVQVPTKCAVNGQLLKGRNFVSIDLGGGYYCAVLAKNYASLKDEHIAEVRSLIQVTPETEVVAEAVEDSDSIEPPAVSAQTEEIDPARKPKKG